MVIYVAMRRHKYQLSGVRMQTKTVETNFPAANLLPGDVVIDYDKFERTVVGTTHDTRHGQPYLVATMHTGALFAYAPGVTVTARLGGDRPHQVECLTCDLAEATEDRMTAAELVAAHADMGHSAFYEPTL